MSKSVNATHFDRIPSFESREKRLARIVNAIIETPKGSCHKYALKPEYGMIAFHEALPDHMTWPYDFGFVPQTLADDGDPLDILVISEGGLFSGCLTEVRVIGSILEVKDDTENDRLLGVPLSSPGAPLPTDSYYDVTDLPPSILDEIKRFLVSYSRAQGHKNEIKDVVGAEAAMMSIKRSTKRFQKKSA